VRALAALRSVQLFIAASSTAALPGSLLQNPTGMWATTEVLCDDNAAELHTLQSGNAGDRHCTRLLVVRNQLCAREVHCQQGCVRRLPSAGCRRAAPIACARLINHTLWQAGCASGLPGGPKVACSIGWTPSSALLKRAPKGVADHQERHVLAVCAGQDPVRLRLHHLAVGDHNRLAVERLLGGGAHAQPGTCQSGRLRSGSVGA
jgi:hypothetical protein